MYPCSSGDGESRPDYICLGGGDVFYEPFVLIEVDLPESAPVQGFRFSNRFLSDQRRTQLYSIFGMDDLGGATLCDAEYQALFEAEAQ